MRLLSVSVLFGLFFFALMPITAQNQEVFSPEAEIEETVNPCFPILSLIRTACEGKIKWHPEQPLRVPPDSFSLISGKAVSIQLEIFDDSMVGKSAAETFICEWNDAGQLIQFPVFRGILPEIPFMAQAHFNQDGEIKHITLRGKQELNGEIAAKTEPEQEAGMETEITRETEIIIEIEVLETNEGNVSLARIHRDDAYYFVVFQYWNNAASETWYNADGNAEGLLLLEYAEIYHMRHQAKTFILISETFLGNDPHTIFYDYDSWGNISNVDAENADISVLYNENSKPKYMKRITQIERITSDLEDHRREERKEDVIFQWDERDLLVSLKGNFEHNADENNGNGGTGEAGEALENIVAEKRYEYTLDENRNWTERREILMIRRGNFLFPRAGFTIRRTIRYGEQFRETTWVNQINGGT